MIERFFIKRFFLYPFINRFKLWGGLIFLHKFARRGILFGWFSAFVVGGLAVVFFMTAEFILGLLLDYGMPHWIYLLACFIYVMPLTALMVITFDLFYVGFSSPNQFLFGNAFWSKTHEGRWQKYVTWLEEQKNGTKG